MCSFSFAAAHPKVGWSLGYYPGWQQAANPPASINWASVTHIVHFTLFPNNDGTLDTANCEIYDSYARAVVAEAHNHGVKCLICLGGANVGSRFATAAANGTRGKLISNMIAFMKKYGYDGIDIDWEESFDNTLILALYKDMRDSLNKISPPPLLTAPVAAYYINNCYFIYPYVSQMNTMDYTVDVNGYPAQLKPFTDKGIPKTELGLGIGIGSGTSYAVHDSNMAKSIADFAIANGYGGIMEWTVSIASLNASVLKALVPYVPAPATFVRSYEKDAYGRETILYVRRNSYSGVSEISYTVPPDDKGGLVDLSLFDMRGVLIKKLVNGQSATGTYSISLNPRGGSGSSINSGSYILRMSTGSGTEAAQISIVK
jgi:hypothetical protein